MDWHCGSANIFLGGKTGLMNAFLWPATPSVPCLSTQNNPSKIYPITIMFFISYLPVFNTKGGSKFTIHRKGFKLVTLCSLSRVTLICTGAAGGNEFKKWQILLKQGTLSTHLASPSQPHEGPAQDEAWGREVWTISQEKSICHVEWQHIAIQNKWAAVQGTAGYGPASSPQEGPDAYLPEHFTHHFDSILKWYFMCKVSTYCQSKIRGLWQMKSVSLAIILVSLSLAD